MSIFLILTASILTTVGAQLFIKKGVLGLEQFDLSLSGFFNFIFGLLHNIWVMVGLFLFGLSFLLWIVVLSKFQLNIIYPVVVSLNFCLITVFSWFLFKEYLSPIQILGIMIIIAGTFLVLSKGLI